MSVPTPEITGSVCAAQDCGNYIKIRRGFHVLFGGTSFLFGSDINVDRAMQKTAQVVQKELEKLYADLVSNWYEEIGAHALPCTQDEFVLPALEVLSKELKRSRDSAGA